MPTSTNVTNLKINELTEAQFDSAVSGGVIGENEISILTDMDEAIQVVTLPTASADELGKVYQFIGTTDANYTHGYFYECVSDGQQPATYSWSNIQVQASSGGLPSQTGNAGKFLTTDGTDASWSDKPLVNSATGSNSVVIGRSDTTNHPTNTVVIGGGSGTQSAYSVAIGYNSSTNTTSGTAIGASTFARNQAVAIGFSASATKSIQISCGTSSSTTNNDANTFKVGNANGNFEMMSADGTIPSDRFTTTPSADGTYYPTLSISSGTATRSWGTISALQNTATGTDSLTILGTPTSYGYSVSIGVNSEAKNTQAVAIGCGAKAWTTSVAVGYGAESRINVRSISVGGFSTATGTNSIAIGAGSFGSGTTASGDHSIQLGNSGTSATSTNSDANTFKVANANGNYEMMSADGTIPTARLTKVNSTITLTAADWISNTQTVNVTGMTATGVVMVSPDPTDQSAYTSAGILCTAQAAGTLTFTCDTVPSADIDVNVVML